MVIWLFVEEVPKPKPMTEIGPMEIDDPALAKYKDQIERTWRTWSNPIIAVLTVLSYRDRRYRVHPRA